ncbi:M14 metallopeptidase family protein [Altibacter sp. HG106]|uniref:M14 metallopeptidase family protein n=1 Tax=Altibacter sp. HG106 TaxID=3023937 RepID=UPI00234FCA1F|nr:M14 metallopeptidase family protein [Altibacter sp. HG106]MDC7993999.1 M14 family metallopeptidase [Altibacter sp. HG106]
MLRYFSLLLLFITSISVAQLKSPAEFLGYEIGTQFSRHADVVNYFEHVAAESDWVQYQTYGKTYERRPLTYAVVTSPSNMNTLETLRKNHLQNAGIEAGNGTSNKAVVWLSYNVHGNEASSTEAAMQTLYQLITEKQEWLENTIVIIDPCVNPDGRDRYTNWYNQVKSTPYNPKQIATEHNEPWPGGRPNHYLFDLNRDWAWASQVESQQRLKVYNKWMPHVHVDFHEQGINEPYYFAPAAEPYHEVITDFQRDFQEEIGKNHAKYFDQEGWLFFTRERFDLLYPSYGDTYPTFMGAIGMTYEQAGHGRAGLGINTDEGFELTLVDRVAHHTTTGLSTVEVAKNNIDRLNESFKAYFNNDDLTYKSYVLTGHPDKINALTELLDLHEIAYGFTAQNSVNGYRYGTNDSGSMDSTGALVVSTNQPKGKMVKVLFEPDAALSNPLTYDITAWSLPQAYGLEAVASTRLVPANSSNNDVRVVNQVGPQGAGYIVTWNSLKDAQFLSDLLQQDIKVRFSEKELRFNGKAYPRGSLLLTKSDNRSRQDFQQVVATTANTHGRTLHAIASSFSDNGTDFGSPDIKLVPKNRIAVLQGEGTSSLSYGSIWHFFEQQLKYPVTSINTSDFNPSAMQQFDVLVMPSGWYRSVASEDTMKGLKDWIRSGGKVIAIGNAVSTFSGEDGFDLTRNSTDDTSEENSEETELIPYDQREKSMLNNFITGSIYKLKMDPSHPMAFGYDDTYFSLKLGSTSYSYLENGYTVGYISDTVESYSGFSGDTAKNGLKNSMVFGEARMGRGSVVYMVDDVLFRSFWENGKLLFVNSLFFVNSNVYRL